ncbi:MAG TPA: LysR family transcriptional regulator [Pseudorhizobium sp.]|nr:LysR family transcriptional regulator [Pseudorhizobium sp.]
MELRQLRYFLAVAEESNVTAASRRLHVSQPPLTRQIRQLEQELKVTLFTRTSKGVQLTDAGKALLTEARRLLILAEAAKQRSQAAQRGELGRLDIGYFGSTIYSVVPSAIRRFSEAMPDVAVRIHRAGKAEQIAQLRDGRLGIGFARHYSPEPDIECMCVAEEKLFLAAKADNSGYEGEANPVSLQMIEGRSLVVFPHRDRPSFADQVLGILADERLQPKGIETAEDVFAALAMTMTSDSLCVVPESVARLNWPELQFLPIVDIDASSPVNCIFLRKDRSSVVEAFLATLQAIPKRHR